MWIHLTSFVPVPLRYGWLPILSCVPTPFICTGPVFQRPPQFGYESFESLRPIPGLTLPHHVKNPRRWPQDPTRRLLTFWCKSETPGHLELPGFPLTLRGSLVWLYLKILACLLYPIKGPWVHVGPISLPGFGGHLSGKSPHTRFCPLGAILNSHNIRQ